MGEFKLKDNAKLPKESFKKKHYWWRYLLTFIGGFVFCVATIVGGAAAFGALIPAGDVISIFGGNPEDVLGENYRNDTLLGLVTKLSTHKFETLGDINEVTPLVKKTLEETINPVLEENVRYSFPWEEISIKPFAETSGTRPSNEVDYSETLGDYIANSLKNNIRIANFLETDGLSNVVKLFLYPSSTNSEDELVFDTNNAYSINDFLTGGSDFFNNIMNNIRIGDVMSLGDDGFLSQIAKWRLNDFNDEAVMNLKIGPLFSESDKNSNPLIKAICDKEWTIADLCDFDNLKALKVSELMDVSGASGMVLAISDFTINDLMTKDISEILLVKDVYPNATSGIMYILRDKSVASLSDPDTFMAIKVGEFLTDLNESDLLYKFKDKTLSELASLDISTLKLTEIFSNSEIEANVIFKALVANNIDVTLGDLSNYETIAALKLENILPASEIENNFILTALVNANATVGSLGDDINALTVGEVIDISNEPTTSMKYRIVNALKDYPFSTVADHFSELKMGDLFDVNDPDTPLVLKALAETTLDNLASKLDSLTVGEVIDIPEGSVLDKEEIKNVVIKDASQFEDVLKRCLSLGDLVEITEDSPKILITLQHTKINDIGDKVLTLKLNDIIEITDDSPQILKSLKNIDLFGDTNNLENALTSLKFKDVFSAEQCTNSFMKSLWDSNDGGDFLISELSDKMSSIKLVDVLEDTIFVDDGSGNKKVDSTWWFLLTEEGESFTEEEKYYNLKKGAEYTMDDMDKLVVNMNYHMQNESIFNLIEAKFIIVEEANLSKLETMVDTNSDFIPDTKIGELTLSEFINICLKLF